MFAKLVASIAGVREVHVELFDSTGKKITDVSWTCR